MPIGWFKVNKAEINEEGNPERVERLVMVYENEYDHYLNLINILKRKFSILMMKWFNWRNRRILLKIGM